MKFMPWRCSRKLNCFFIAFFLCTLTMMTLGQQVQMGSNGRNPLESQYPPPVPLRRPLNAPPYAPDAMSEGNCHIDGRILILQLSDDPVFTALIKEGWRHPSMSDSKRKEWVKRLKPFAPLFYKGLQSENGCIQLDSISYLSEMKDTGAVEPFFKLVNKYPLESSAVAMEALRSLAVVYHDKRTVPYLVKIIRTAPIISPLFQMAESATNYRFRDERLWYALAYRFEHCDSKVDPGLLAQALGIQSSAVSNKDDLTAFFKRNIYRINRAYQAVDLARMTSSPEIFDGLAAFYKKHCKDNNGSCYSIALKLTEVGGSKVIPFWTSIAEEAENPGMRSFAATQAVDAFAKELPEHGISGQTIMDLLVRRCKKILPFARESSICTILQLAPEAKPEASLTQQAAYWEKAASVLTSNKKVYCWIEHRLFNIYGHKGLNDDKKALAAITEALDNYTPRYGTRKPREWTLAQKSLRRKFRSEKLIALTRIEGLAPIDKGKLLGTWTGKLVVPVEAIGEVRAAPPVAYLEFIGPDGKTKLVPSDLKFGKELQDGSEKIPFKVLPEEDERESITDAVQIRLMLIFIYSGKGISGTVLSSLVPVN